MAEIAKVNNVAWADLAGVGGVAKASIGKMGTLDAPAGGVTAVADLEQWWKLNEGTGTSAANAVDGGTALTHVSVTHGANGNRTSNEDVVDYDGNAGYSEVSIIQASNNHPNYESVGDSLMQAAVSVTFWMKIETDTDGHDLRDWECPFIASSVGAWRDGMGCYFHTTSGTDTGNWPNITGLWFWTAKGEISGDSGVTNYLNSYAGAAIASNAAGWHHVACVVDAPTSIMIYIDGSAGTQITSGGSILTPRLEDDTVHRHLSLAAFHKRGNDGTAYLSPLDLSDFRIYDKALSGAEVSAIASTGSPDWP